MCLPMPPSWPEIDQPLLKELDFLPPHNFCQNEFLCLLISVEHYVYHSGEKETLSRTIAPANLLEAADTAESLEGN